MDPQKKYRYYIGIDPGTTTGLALWDRPAQEFAFIDSGAFIAMYQKILTVDLQATFFRIEDARQRSWFGNMPRTAKAWEAERGKLQGVGSVKRDCSLWEEVCEHHGWEYQMVHPAGNKTKMKADAFQRITGWEGRTNHNQRDAAMLVFGY